MTKFKLFLSNGFEFEVFSTKIIAFLLFAYFAIPNLDIFSIGKFSIRIADFISLIIMVCVTPVIFRFFRQQSGIIFIVILSLQLLIGYAYSGWFQFFYVGRFFQYFLIGLALFVLARSIYFKKWVYSFTLIQVVFAVAQFFLILPNFDSARGIYYGKTFSGSFGTPAEFSYFFFLLFFMFGLSKLRWSILGASLLSLNGVIAAAFFFISLSFRRLSYYVNARLLLIASLGVIAFGSVFLLKPNVLTQVVSEPSYSLNFELKKGVGLTSDDFIYDDPVLKSFHMRVNKFVSIYEGWRNAPLVTIFGCGFGCGDGAIDSGILRWVLEFGLLGLFLLLKISPLIDRSSFLTLILSNILFDAFWSSSTSPLIIAIALLGLLKKRVMKATH